MDVPQTGLIFAFAQHTIRRLGTQGTRRPHHRRREDDLESVGRRLVGESGVLLVLIRWCRGDRAAVGIGGRLLLVTVIVLTMLRVDGIVTGKFFLEPTADSLKHPGGLVHDTLAELDDRRTISVCPLTNSFAGVPVRIVFRRSFLLAVIRRRIDLSVRRRGRWPG